MKTLTLGRDGMGSECTEANFDAWVSYVSDRIDGECGFEVPIDTRQPRDVQADAISADTDDERQTIRDAKQRLWDAFCADDSAWPARESA